MQGGIGYLLCGTLQLALLNALRLALIHRIWLFAVALPEFSPRHDATREALVRGILQLDVERALKLLAEAFSATPDPARGGISSKPRRRVRVVPMRGNTPRCSSRWAPSAETQNPTQLLRVAIITLS